MPMPKHAWKTPLNSVSAPAHSSHSPSSMGFRPLVIPPMTYGANDVDSDRDSDGNGDNSDGNDDMSHSTTKIRCSPQPPFQETTSYLFDYSTDLNFHNSMETPPASTVNRAPPSGSNRIMSI